MIVCNFETMIVVMSKYNSPRLQMQLFQTWISRGGVRNKNKSFLRIQQMQVSQLMTQKAIL